MRKDFVPPAWVRQMVGVADAGVAANATLRLMTAKHYPDVFALPRTRQLTTGPYRRAWVQHLPKSCSHRRASHQPDGRRRDSWVFTRRAPLHNLGAGTLVLAKKRRNDGPKGVKMLVTNLTVTSAGAMLRIYARRWGGEWTIKAWQSGLHLGQRHVTKEAGRVRRSVALAVLAYLWLLRL
jgi:hypothetical protein